jgi:hypothetical protein
MSADDFAEAVRIVWRLLEKEAGLPADSIQVGLNLKRLLSRDRSLKERLLRGVESATGGMAFDGLWQSRDFTMPALIDHCALLVNGMRESLQRTARTDQGPDRERLE